MAEAAVEVLLGGDEGGISARSYTGVLGQLTLALEEIDRVVEPDAASRPVWRVTDTEWRRDVGAVVQLTPTLRRRTTRTTADLFRPGRELWGGVMELSQQPEIPQAFTASVVARVSNIRQQIERKSTGLTSVAIVPLSGPSAIPADISDAVEQNAAKAVAIASLAYGSLIGRLDMISARGKVKKIGLRTDFGPPVMCAVDSLEQGVYMDAFERRVLVSGLLKRNARGQAVSLHVDALELLPETGRISATRLLGALPELGGTLPATEYIRGRRGE